MNYHMLACGAFSNEFCAYINQNYSDLIDCRSTEKISQKDLDGIDALAGFYQFDDLNLSEIKWIHAFGAGVDAYLRQPSLAPGTQLTRTLGYMDRRIGEFCLAHILSDLKNVIFNMDLQRKKEWSRTNLDVLYTKKILIYGTGFVGRGIAHALSNLCACIEGISHSGHAKAPFDKVHAISRSPDLSEYDIIINALPLTDQTHHFFSHDYFRKLNGPMFINVGRGQSLVESDLIKALDAGHIRKAVLDVFQTEPLPEISPLWEHPKVVVTPHHSGLTTFEDIKKSFDEVMSHLKVGNRNELFVDLKKGY